MHIRVALEKGIENRTLAWALDYPGCFAYGEADAEALLRLPHALLKHDIWIKDHTDSPWTDFTDLDLNVVDTWQTYYIDDNYNLTSQGKEINAWFNDDWRPLSKDEIEQGLLIFRWQREELLAGVGTLSKKLLERQLPNQRWNIYGIMKHIANAENWYLDRLAYTTLSRKDIPTSPIEHLELTQAVIERIFLKFENEDRVFGKDGEFWSCRKILRRTLWHQRDHIEHIKQLALGT